VDRCPVAETLGSVGHKSKIPELVNSRIYIWLLDIHTPFIQLQKFTESGATLDKFSSIPEKLVIVICSLGDQLHIFSRNTYVSCTACFVSFLRLGF
jgi:hypothetical protein